MTYADFEDARWHMDPLERFRVCLPAGWLLTPSSDPDAFRVCPAASGPGDLRLCLVQGDGTDWVRGGEVVRAAAETRPGVQITEADGCVRATYARRVVTPFGEDLQYIWEVGSGGWVAVWSYVVDGRLRTSPGVSLEYRAVTDVVATFRFASAIAEA